MGRKEGRKKQFKSWRCGLCGIECGKKERCVT